MQALVKNLLQVRIEKPRADFYAHPKMADSLLGKCKACQRANMATARAA